jgi:hypothetical protein
MFSPMSNYRISIPGWSGTGQFRVATIKDPAGNMIMFSQTVGG